MSRATNGPGWSRRVWQCAASCLPAALAVGLLTANVLPSGAPTTVAANPIPQAAGVCGAIISVDTPAGGAVIQGPTTIAGWAVDSAATADTGVTAVQVYLDGPRDGGGTLIGSARYGLSRPDLAANLGANFEQAAWDLAWDPGNKPGPRTLFVYAQTACGWELQQVAVDVQPIACQPQMAVEFPAANAKVPNTGEITIYGWALDPLATAGPGVSDLQLSQNGKVLGSAKGGFSRVDVASTNKVTSTAFLNSGFAFYVDTRTIAPDAGSGNLGKATLTVTGNTGCGPLTRSLTVELADPNTDEAKAAVALIAPRNLRLTKWENGAASLAWDPSPSKTVDTYEIQMARLGAGYQNKGSVPGSTTTFDVTSLNASEQYSFLVYAKRGDQISRGTSSVSTALPPNPTGGIQATPTPEPVDQYGRPIVPTPAANTGGGFFGLPGAGGASAPVGTPVPGATAVPAGTLPTPAISTANYTPTPQPAVMVTFQAVSGATGYQLQRSTSATGGYQIVGQSLGTQTQIIDTTRLTPGTYYYQVIATGNNNQRSQPSQPYPVTVR